MTAGKIDSLAKEQSREEKQRLIWVFMILFAVANPSLIVSKALRAKLGL